MYALSLVFVITTVISHSQGAVVSDQRKKDQSTVDNAILKVLGSDKSSVLKQYLSARFSIKNGDRPHEMTF